MYDSFTRSASSVVTSYLVFVIDRNRLTDSSGFLPYPLYEPYLRHTAQSLLEPLTESLSRTAFYVYPSSPLALSESRCEQQKWPMLPMITLFLSSSLAL